MAEVFCGLSAEEDTAFCTEAELDARIRAALGTHYLKLGCETEHTLPQELVQTLLGGDLVERGSVTRRAAQRFCSSCGSARICTLRRWAAASREIRPPCGIFWKQAVRWKICTLPRQLRQPYLPSTTFSDCAAP